MKKVIDFFTAHPARFFLLAALLWGGFMCFLNYKDGAEFSWHDLLVEANGVVFDLLVFGVLLSIYEALREKRDKIQRLHEEIDDYRGWDEKEAMFRIVGAVKRLNKLGVSKIGLNDCFLQEADFWLVNLQKANLQRTDLQRATFGMANLQETDFAFANLQETNLRLANLRGTILWEANLKETILWEANLKGAILFKTDFEGANFEGASVDKDWFEKLDKWEVIGREEIKAKYFIDDEGILREKQ